MESKYLEFIKLATLPQTDVYGVFTKSERIPGSYKLGEIKWYGRWKQYAFFPCSESVWNNWNKKCLEDIIKFIQEIN